MTPIIDRAHPRPANPSHGQRRNDRTAASPSRRHARLLAPLFCLLLAIGTATSAFAATGPVPDAATAADIDCKLTWAVANGALVPRVFGSSSAALPLNGSTPTTKTYSCAIDGAKWKAPAPAQQPPGAPGMPSYPLVPTSDPSGTFTFQFYTTSGTTVQIPTMHYMNPSDKPSTGSGSMMWKPTAEANCLGSIRGVGVATIVSPVLSYYSEPVNVEASATLAAWTEGDLWLTVPMEDLHIVVYVYGWWIAEVTVKNVPAGKATASWKNLRAIPKPVGVMPIVPPKAAG